MRPLFLERPALGVRGRRLLVTDLGKSRAFDLDRSLPFDSVVVEGGGGWVSFQALRWLAFKGATLTHLDHSGAVLSVSLADGPPRAEPRLAQFAAYHDPDRRLAIAEAIVRAKTAAYLRARPEIAWAAKGPRPFRSLDDAMLFEARVTAQYFDALGVTRSYPNAKDPTNAALNYAYGLLASRVRIAIHRAGLDPRVGFLHQTRPHKESLVYDLQEPYRTVADSVALEIERSLPRRAFTRSYGYGVRLGEKAARRMVETFGERWSDIEREFGRDVERFARDLETGARPTFRALRLKSTVDSPTFHSGKVLP